MVFLFVFFFWDSYDSNVGAFNIVSEVSEIVSFLLIHFSIFLSDSFISTISTITSLILSSASIILLFVPSRVFFYLFIALFWRGKWQPTPVFLPGESQGWRSLVGCCLWGHTELDKTEAPWQQQHCIIHYILILFYFF